MKGVKDKEELCVSAISKFRKLLIIFIFSNLGTTKGFGCINNSIEASNPKMKEELKISVLKSILWIEIMRSTARSFLPTYNPN